jgi:hypothetical protein
MLIDPRLLEELVKLADHADDRLKERTDLPPHVLHMLRKRVRGVELPKGSHHVVLPDGSFAVVKDVGIKNPKNVVATVLGRNMSPPGENLTHVAYGVDPDERMRGERGFGRNSSHEAYSHFKRNPHGFESSESFSQVKVSQAVPQEYSSRALKVMLYPKSSMEKYRQRMQSGLELIPISVEDIPLVPPPENDSDYVLKEIEDILDIMANKPLSDAMLRKCEDDLMGIFIDLCESLDVDPMTEDIHVISEDISKIGLMIKYVFRRPRPEMVANYLGRKIVPIENDQDSPSYPSGHALKGYGLAKFYSDAYPEHSKDFYSAADAVALSRIQGGLHFPSDVAYSKGLIDFIFEAMNHGQPSINLVEREIKNVTPQKLVQNVEPPKNRTKELTYEQTALPKPILDEREKTSSFAPFSNLDKLVRR